MKVPRIRMTVFRLILLIAIAAIAAHLAIEPNRTLAAVRRGRCLDLATRHATLGSEYRRNAGGDARMLKLAAWREHMRSEFERAAADRTIPVPRIRSSPPKGWAASAVDAGQR